MTKLKTLKDLKHLVEREEGIPDYEAVDLLTLKAEAVKWVKKMQAQLETDFGFESPVGIERLHGGFDGCEVVGFSAEDFIKHFFNLTEEDLK